MNNIYDWALEEEKNYIKPIALEEGWDWSMREHLRRSFLYLNSQFEENNEDRFLRPNFNIVLPILNVQYRTEGFDVKDIEIFVDNPDEYHKSLVIKKYHDNWVLWNEIDTFIDEMVTSYCTYGGVLVRKTGKARPEVVDLRTLAFCNQVNILDNPFAIRHKYSFAQIRRENEKWGRNEYGATMDVETLIYLAKKEGKSEVEVWEIHGVLPIEWLHGYDKYYDEKTKDLPQVHIISYYTDENQQKRGVTLFRNREPKLPFKFFARDRVEGRALGRGGVEELFEPQVWTNWDTIKITEMLDAASKTLFFSDDPTFKTRNNLSRVENNEVLQVQRGSTLQQVNTYPRNLAVFNDAVARWQEHAQRLGAASEFLLGESPSSGTPFKLFEAKTIEDKGLHRYRQGQLATFMDEIYRDWILPHLSREVIKEKVFMGELSTGELEEVAERITENKVNQFRKYMVLGLQLIDEELIDRYREQVKADIRKNGTKRFFKILKNEMKDIALSVHTNIAGKQKNLALLTDKLVNVLRQYIATPQIREDPAMQELLNVILESSGLSPIMFGPSPASLRAPVQPAPVSNTQPLEKLGERQLETQPI